MMSDFDPKSYWEERLEKTYGLDGVGYLGLGKKYNNWMYKVRRKIFNRTIKKEKLGLADKSVLDVGSGTGFYIDRWKENGAKDITGVDLTSVAVRNLTELHKDCTFHQLDISTSIDVFEGKQFDVISCFDVLYHVVEEEKFNKALENIHKLLKPGGVFVVSDNFIHNKKWEVEHQVVRTDDEFCKGLTDAGFKLGNRKAMFYMMNMPVDSNSKFLNWIWKTQLKFVHRSEWWGNFVGMMVYPWEMLALRLIKDGPSTEMQICQKK